MDGDDTADNEVGGALVGAAAQTHGLHPLALHLHRAFADALCGDIEAVYLGKAGFFKLVNLRGIGGRGEIHLLHHCIGDHVVNKAAGLLGVHGAVLAGAVGTELRGEEDMGVIKIDVRELAVSGKIVNAVFADGGDEADGSGNGDTLEDVLAVELFKQHFRVSVAHINAYHGFYPFLYIFIIYLSVRSPPMVDICFAVRPGTAMENTSLT